MKKLKKIENICFYYKNSVLKAMEAINNKSLPYLIITNKKNQLLGTITDGDIRRHILKGYDLNQNIDIAMNKKPIFCYEDQNKIHQKKLLSIESVKKFLPILDRQKRIKYILLHEKEEDDNIVLIMAGGFGKRLGRKTKKIPKPLLKIGKKVVLDIILKKIYNSNFKKIYISTHYLHNKIDEYVKTKHKNKGITLIHEKKPMGTAGCISLINEPFDNLLVINGDVISNIDLGALMSFHYETKNDITLSAAKYTYKVPFGLIELDNKHRLKNIKEKPNLDYNVVSGIYCLKKNICNMVSKGHLDMTTLISNSIQINKTIGVFPIYEYWQDIGNPDDLTKAKTEYI